VEATCISSRPPDGGCGLLQATPPCARPTAARTSVGAHASSINNLPKIRASRAIHIEHATGRRTVAAHLPAFLLNTRLLRPSSNREILDAIFSRPPLGACGCSPLEALKIVPTTNRSKRCNASRPLADSPPIFPRKTPESQSSGFRSNRGGHCCRAASLPRSARDRTIGDCPTKPTQEPRQLAHWPIVSYCFCGGSSNELRCLYLGPACTLVDCSAIRPPRWAQTIRAECWAAIARRLGCCA